LFPIGHKELESGYTLFKNQCITEYWKENELVDYIVNPAAYRNKVKMPTLGISKQQSQEIVAYLKYMSENKKKI
jgi:cytochrome c2